MRANIIGYGPARQELAGWQVTLTTSDEATGVDYALCLIIFVLCVHPTTCSMSFKVDHHIIDILLLFVGDGYYYYSVIMFAIR